MMKIINELITPFNLEKEIDIDVFNKLIEKSHAEQNNYQLVFSTFGDGLLLTLEEKKALINSIKKEYLPNIIYYFQLENENMDSKTINFLNNSDLEYIMICPPLKITYSQTGLYLYVKNIIKKLKNKKIILHNTSLNNCVNFHFQTIKKLIKNNNLIGIYENGIDYSLIGLIQTNFPEFEIYVKENLIEYALDHHLSGIISLTSLLYNEDIISVIDDYSNDFKNTLLINYILFVHEILSFSNNSTLFKAYLKRLGYPSMEVRLPLIIEQADIDNLDFLLS